MAGTWRVTTHTRMGNDQDDECNVPRNRFLLFLQNVLVRGTGKATL